MAKLLAVQSSSSSLIGWSCRSCGLLLPRVSVLSKIDGFVYVQVREVCGYLLDACEAGECLRTARAPFSLLVDFHSEDSARQTLAASSEVFLMVSAVRLNKAPRREERRKRKAKRRERSDQVY